MTFDELADECIRQLETAGRETTRQLLDAIHPWPFADEGDIAEFIHGVDIRTKDIATKISAAIMDGKTVEMTRGDELMMRLRIENAIHTLKVLSSFRPACRLETDIPEEAYVWATTALWQISGSGPWVHHTARSLWAGKPSGLSFRSF